MEPLNIGGLRRLPQPPLGNVCLSEDKLVLLTVKAVVA